jgi:hypothetical protein
VTLTTAGSQTVAATDVATRSITGAQTTVNAAADTLVLNGLFSPATAGSAQTVTVTAEDVYGNVATGYLGTVHFTSTHTNAETVLPADYSFTPADAGAHTFTNGVTLTTAGSQTVTATDTNDSTLTGSGTVSVVTEIVSVSNPGNQSATVGTTVSLQIQASDSGGATLTYSATGLPPGLSINSATGVISGTPTNTGTYSVTVTASTGTASGSTSFIWTVTPSGGGSSSPGQKLGNPGLETGSAAPWTTSAAVINPNGAGETSPSGTWYAWLDGYGTTRTDTLSQTVTLPSGCSSYTFSFWLHIDTAEVSRTTAFDTLKVQAGSTTLATSSNLNAASGYTQHSYDLTAFAGQTITLKFTGSEDSSLQTSFVIDDTALNVS